jgi:hypothetical protein
MVEDEPNRESTMTETGLSDEPPASPNETRGRVNELAPDWAKEGPVPPRLRWLRRVLAVTVVFALILTVLRWWWGWDAHRRLQAEIDKIVAAGEPIYPEDFDPPEPVPDDENAAHFLLDAEIALDLTQEDEELIGTVIEDRLELYQRLDEVHRLVERNLEALRLVRQARSRMRADWGLRVRSPAVTTMFVPLDGQRRLGKLLVVAAESYHAAGDEAAAAETMRDLAAQARAVDWLANTLSHYNAIALEGLLVRKLEELLPFLAVPAVSEEGAGGRADGIRELVTGLLLDLLDEELMQDGLIRAAQRERMVLADSVDCVVDGRLSLSFMTTGATTSPFLESVSVSSFRPLYMLDEAFGIRFMTRYVEASRAASWPAAKAASPVITDEPSRWQRMRHPVTTTMLPWYGHFQKLHFRALANRRMAATALGIRLYEVDNGRRPERLAELVPEYLPAVPVDPFAADGRAIGYRPDASPPVLYSIGVDGIDDSGAFTFYGSGMQIHWDKLDNPFFLDGNRPRKTEPEDDERGTGPSDRPGGEGGAEDTGHALAGHESGQEPARSAEKQ